VTGRPVGHQPALETDRLRHEEARRFPSRRQVVKNKGTAHPVCDLMAEESSPG
jgi:hypothetical protein